MYQQIDMVMKQISIIFLSFFALVLQSSCKKQKSFIVKKRENIVKNVYVAKPVDHSVSSRYDSIGDFSSGYATVFKNGKKGLINIFGCEITPCLYDFVGPFSNGIAMIHLDGKLGYINKIGDVIVKPKYDLPEYYMGEEGYNPDFFELSDGLIGVILDKEYGFVNSSGKEVIPCKYVLALPFKDGLTFIIRDAYWYIIDKKGREIKLAKKYSKVSAFNGGLARVALNCPAEWGNQGSAVFGYIDRTGKEIIPCIYEFDCYDLNIYGEDREYFSEGLLMVKRNGKYGFINKMGEKVTPLKYDNADPFSEGLAAVLLNKKWGFINRKGKVVIPFKYDSLADGFRGGFAAVCQDRLDNKNQNCGLINKNGKIVVPLKYDYSEIPYPGTKNNNL